jgi:hypothetical protein
VSHARYAAIVVNKHILTFICAVMHVLLVGLMPFYNVVVHAPCVPVQLELEAKPRGFYAPCFVRADSPDGAVAKALAWVRANPQTLRIAARFASSSPELVIDRVARISWLKYLRGDPGWVLYDESRLPRGT